MIGRLALALRDWILAGLVVCPQCRALVDRHHGSDSCGRFLRDTTNEQHRRHERLAARVHRLEQGS